MTVSHELKASEVHDQVLGALTRLGLPPNTRLTFYLDDGLGYACPRDKLMTDGSGKTWDWTINVHVLDELEDFEGPFVYCPNVDCFCEVGEDL
jgi:hypothetical protein